ncbi:MAG: hypothetical protein ACLU7V_06455 [Anaerovoracaceae bacterium]
MNNRTREMAVKKKYDGIRKKGNRFLYGFLIIFISGYLIFFTSPFWMPDDYLGVDVTEPGEVISGNDREVTMIAWTYSKDHKEMEVVLEIVNASLDGIERYDWTAFDAQKGRIRTETVAETDDFAVIHLLRVPDGFTEISLRMEAPDSDSDGAFSMLRFYTSKKAVENVSSIKDRSLHEYRIYAADCKIRTYRGQIRDLEENSKKQQDLIAEAEEKIKNLKQDQKYQAEDEKAETDSLISQLKTQKDDFADIIEENDSSIAELEEKIKLQEERRRKLGG